jgi:hypothetical protein
MKLVGRRRGVKADVFIEFLTRLLVDERRAIFLIVDRGPAHRAKRPKHLSNRSVAGCSSCRLTRRIEIPDELVWKHLKVHTMDRMVLTGKADFKSKVVSSMHRLQKNPGKISSFKSRLYDMPLECETTYGQINNMMTPLLCFGKSLGCRRTFCRFRAPVHLLSLRNAG